MKKSWKLTAEQKLEAARLYAAGMKLDAISAEFDVVNNTILQIARAAGHPPRRLGNKPRRKIPAREDLLSMFDYEPDTGLLRWKVRPSARSRKRSGDEAGSSHHSGYVQVGVGGALLMAHRVIWKMQTGCDPVDEIDHRNGVRNDNRWDNLRPADRSVQGANKTTPNWHRGVHYIAAKKKYGAQIKWRSEHFWLGVFDTPEQACAAYRARAAELHGDYAKPGPCGCR